MGRFEDLVEQAATGDQDAAQALLDEFSATALRDQAERVPGLEQELESLRPIQRQQRFDDLAAKLDEGLREVLTVEDVGETETESLSLEMLQDLATTKVEAVQATKLVSAKEHGFETVEEYESALQTLKQEADERKTGMESVSSGVTASGGGETGGGQAPTMHEAGQKAFKNAKDDGATDDIGMARGIEAILDLQSEAPTE